MNAEYFREHLYEELNGAEEYIKNAIEIKPMNREWSEKFIKMSSDELEHARLIFNMFQNYYSAQANIYTEIPDYIEELNCLMTDVYTKRSSEISHMHSLIR